MLDRLERLSPDTVPLWGSMNAPQMLDHQVKWMRMAAGDLETAFMNLPLRYPLVKHFVIYWMPWPRGVPTAPELMSAEPADWAGGRAAVRQLIQSFEKRDPKAAWAMHPAFGKLSSRAWGVLGYRHMDHHFRQFGV